MRGFKKIHLFIYLLNKKNTQVGLVYDEELRLFTHTFEHTCKCTSRKFPAQRIPSGLGISKEGERPMRKERVAEGGG